MIGKSFIFRIWFVGLIMILTAQARAQADNCNDVLITKNITTVQYDQEIAKYAAQLIDERYYSEHQTDISGYYGPIGGSYSDFKKSADSHFSFSENRYNQKEAFSALTLLSPPGAVEAWAECMSGSGSRLTVWMTGSLDSKNLSLWIKWRAPQGLDGKALTDVKAMISVGNEKPEALKDVSTSLEVGTSLITVYREKVAETKIDVSGKLNGTTISGQFILPAFKDPAPTLLESPLFISKHKELLISADNVHGDIQFGRVYWQDGVWVGNVNYDGLAIGEHAPSQGVARASFRIPNGARYFYSVVGFARQDTTNGSGDAIVRVFVDDQEVWVSRLTGPQRDGSVVTNTPNIGLAEGSQVLRLEADSAGPNWSDHVTWANPQFKSKL